MHILVGECMLYGKILSKHLELMKSKPTEEKPVYRFDASYLDLPPYVFCIKMINKSLKTV